MEKEFLLLIDGSSLLSTQFFGSLPRQILFAKTPEEKEAHFHKILQTNDGFYTNGVFGFLKYLFKILKEQKPTHLAIAWDLTRDTFRKRMYADYKSNRSEILAPLADQFAICEAALHTIGIPQFMSSEYEADDFCGSLAAKFEEVLPVYILTKDNDYLQLVNDRTKLWLMHSGAEKTDELYKKYKIDKASVNAPERSFVFDKQLIKREFGVEAENINSLKGIMGDSSDNIKGVSGVGEATARALIGEYKTVDLLYKELNGKTKKELEELKNRWKTELGIKRSPLSYLLKTSDTELVGEQAARLSEELATIKKDIPLDSLSLDDLKINLKREESLKVLLALQMQSIHLDSLDDTLFNVSLREKTGYDLMDALENGAISENGKHLIHHFFQKMEKIKLTNGEGKKKQKWSYEEITELEFATRFFEEEMEEEYVGFSFYEDGLRFAMKEKEVFLRMEGFLTGSFLANAFRVFVSRNKNISFVTFHLKDQLPFIKGNLSSNLYDLAVAHYLLNPLAKDHSPAEVSKDYEGMVEEEDYLLYAKAAYLFAEKIMDDVKAKGMEGLFLDVEMPLITTLYEMEQRGVKIDKLSLKKYSEELEELIETYEKEIYELAGEVFNINSPKQLGVILFEKLKLPHGKKTKSGYSTSAEVLERIKYEDPIVLKVLAYRQVAKLKSTYTEGLEAYIKEDGRIHCKLNQLVTATGRLSSTEPNLQNIPIRTELGKKIRKAFVPEEGYVFIDADYSQIELRIMAHLSEDEELIRAYQGEKDIHRITASKVFQVPFSEVTDEQRRNAKAVNFGILYGISSFGLGENLGISRKEAERYIFDYFSAYPKVKEYLDRLVAFAKEEGYVKTFFKRIRPIPELSSHNYRNRQFGKRIAMNSPVQGTSADIIKIAMNRIHQRLKVEFPESKLILQIHDELLVEAKECDKENISKLVYEEMIGAAKLSVPLEAEVKFGYNWYDSH